MKRSGTSPVSGERACKIQSDLKDKVREVFMSARYLFLSGETIQRQLNHRVYESDEWSRVPGYVQSYIHGYIDACRDGQQRDLVWVKMVDGKLLTSYEVDALTAKEKEEKKDLTPDYLSPWQRVDTDLCRFVWKDEAGKPLLNKPFDQKFR